MCQTRGGGGIEKKVCPRGVAWGAASVPLYAGWEVVSRGEGRGHTALLYSHRYRGISIAASQTQGGGGGGDKREHHISAMLSQHVNAMHVLMELETFRGHVVVDFERRKKGAASVFVLEKANGLESSSSLGLKH